MVRKRPSSEEETAEEEGGRRKSLRYKKRIRYACDTEPEDTEEDDTEEENEQPGPSNGFNQRAQEKPESPSIHQIPDVWPVTCGNKTGFLDLAKFNEYEECIQCEDQWFLPQKFEIFCGKGSNKKWKSSIYYKNKPLQHWFNADLLRRGKRPTKRKTRSSNHNHETSFEESELPTEDSENENDDEEDRGSSKLGFVLNSNGGGEERARVEDVEGDSGENESEGKEKAENGEMEGRGTELQKVMNGEKAVHKEVKVVVKRLQEAHKDSLSASMELSLPESRCGPLEEEQNKDDRDLITPTPEDPSDTAAADVTVPITAISVEDEDTPEELSQESELPTEDSENENDDEEDRGSSKLGFVLNSNGGGEERARVEDVEGDSGENESEGKEKAENGEMEGRGTELQKVMNGEKAVHKEVKVVVKRLQEVHKDSLSASMEPSLPESRCGPLEEEQKKDDRDLITPTPEDPSDTAAADVTVPITAISVEDEDTPEELSQGTERKQEKQGVRRTAAESPPTPPAVDSTSEIQNETQVRGSSPVPSTSCNLDTMDLNQLQRESFKMQMKVLKLQEEYYSLKLKELKQERISKVPLV